MCRIMMKKNDFEATNEDECCCGIDSKKALTIFSTFAIISIATSAIAWIGLMNIKQNDGKLPWER